MEIPLLSSSTEDIAVGLSDCDLYIINCIFQSIKIQINKKDWHQATKLLTLTSFSQFETKGLHNGRQTP
jgi:hypothetical protein